MDRNHNIFEQLALVTMDLDHQELGKNPFQENQQDDLHNDSTDDKKSLSNVQFQIPCNQQESNEWEPDLGPGIIFRIDRNLNTFCLRAIATNDINETLLTIPGDDVLKRKLRIEKLASEQTAQVTLDYCFEHLVFFKLDFDVASIVIDQLANKRLPIDEQRVCNISDPGFSWWLECDNDKLSVHFRTPARFEAETIFNLGPMGDIELANQMFMQALSYWSENYGIGEYTSDYKTVQVTTNLFNGQWFNAFKNLLLDGDNIFERKDFENSDEGEMLFLYFEELSAMRRFWIEVENRL